MSENDEPTPSRLKTRRCGATDPWTQTCPERHVCYLYAGHEGEHVADHCHHRWADPPAQRWPDLNDPAWEDDFIDPSLYPAPPALPAVDMPTPTAVGFDLYEHWATVRPGRYRLLKITSSADEVLRSSGRGDWILKRRYTPTGEPTVMLAHASSPTRGESNEH